MEQSEYLLYINQDMRWMSCLFSDIFFSPALMKTPNAKMEQRDKKFALNTEQMTNTPQNLLC